MSTTSSDRVKGGLFLPSVLQRRLDQAVDAFIYPAPETKQHFLVPAGEPSLTGPDSVSWQVFKNPLALFIGGVAAVILELAEPRVRTGVWNHTTFRRDALARLRRTGLAAMMTVYGPRSRTETMTKAIAQLHARVNGLTPDGVPYRADDPELLHWVHATAGFGFLQAYNTYVRPLADVDCDRFYAEGTHAARLYGASGAPDSQAQIAAMFHQMRNRLEPSPIVFDFLQVMRQVSLLPRPLRPVQGVLINAAIDIVPEWVRIRLELDERWSLSAWQRRAVRYIGTVADKIVLRSSPAVLACRRLGLPDDYLYKQHRS